MMNEVENYHRIFQNVTEIVENTVDSIWSINRNYDIIYVNDVFKKAYLNTFNILLEPGINKLQSMPDALVPLWKNRYDKVLGGERLVFTDTVEVPGMTIYIEVAGNPIVQDGEITGACFSGRDVTENRKALEALSKERTKLNNIIIGTRTGTWEWNVQTGATEFNERWAEIIGYSLDELSPVSIETWKKHSHPEDLKRSSELLDKHFSGELDYYECEARMRHKNGDWVWILDRGMVTMWTKDGKPLMMMGTHQDITRRKRAEEELIESNRKLEEMNAAKDKFFSIIAHDLRSPFNSIMGFTELISEQVRERDYANLDHYTKIILQSSHRVMDLLTNLLEWSRSQTGRIEYNPQCFEIVDFIRDTSQLFDQLAAQKSISIVAEMPSGISVFADKLMISTVLRNLLSNAIKYTRPGGTIVISARSNQEKIEVTIADNGIGIARERVARLFRIEQNESTLGTNQEKGTGLGLILCREFIEKHGGRIWAESIEGKGSVFSFSLPSGKSEFANRLK